MNTFSKLWGIRTPAEAQAKIEEQRKRASYHRTEKSGRAGSLLAGRDVYEKLIKGYTEK